MEGTRGGKYQAPSVSAELERPTTHWGHWERGRTQEPEPAEATASRRHADAGSHCGLAAPRPRATTGNPGEGLICGGRRSLSLVCPKQKRLEDRGQVCGRSLQAAARRTAQLSRPAGWSRGAQDPTVPLNFQPCSSFGVSGGDRVGDMSTGLFPAPLARGVTFQRVAVTCAQLFSSR